MHDGDILMTYSDGIVEAKDNDGNFYGMERLEKSFLEAAQNHNTVFEVYDALIEDIKLWKSGTSFLDDTTVLLLKRNQSKDILTSDSVEIQSLKAKEGLSGKEVKRLENKTKEEIDEELNKIRKEKETENIIKILEGLYYT